MNRKEKRQNVQNPTLRYVIEEIDRLKKTYRTLAEEKITELLIEYLGVPDIISKNINLLDPTERYGHTYNSYFWKGESEKTIDLIAYGELGSPCITLKIRIDQNIGGWGGLGEIKKKTLYLYEEKIDSTRALLMSLKTWLRD